MFVAMTQQDLCLADFTNNRTGCPMSFSVVCKEQWSDDSGMYGTCNFSSFARAVLDE